MKVTIEKIAMFQVQLEEVDRGLESLEDKPIDEANMRRLLTSFRKITSSFSDCLEDLAVYVKKDNDNCEHIFQVDSKNASDGERGGICSKCGYKP